MTVTDPDEPDLEISSTSVTDVPEGGAVGTYTIKPATEPSGEFTVMVASDNDVVQVPTQAFTFNAANWTVAQQVPITAIADDDAFNDTATITHTVTMTEGDHLEYHGIDVDSVSVTVDDNDTPAVNVSTTELTVNEGGSGTYNIFLDTLPVDPTTGNPSSVTVTITQPSNTDITTTNLMTLDSSNWDTGATVMVEVADDADTTADSATLTHTVTGADYADASVNNVVVTANDLDTEGVSISETGVTPTEGSTATYQVNLNTQPTGTVAVTPSSDNSNVTFAPANLMFTSSTWNTLQTVTVTAAEDADAAVDTATIAHTVSGAEYNSAPKPGDVAVTVTENDSLDIMVSPTTREIDEVQGGTGTATYEVELAAAPTGGVVTIVMTVTGDANVTTSPNPLTFRASDWATPTTASFSQTVTVNVSEDPRRDGPGDGDDPACRPRLIRLRHHSRHCRGGCRGHGQRYGYERGDGFND